jgi:hypothetical protein
MGLMPYYFNYCKYSAIVDISLLIIFHSRYTQPILLLLLLSLVYRFFAFHLLFSIPASK